MKIQKDVSLKNHTTFKIGGKADYFVEAKSKKDIISAINWAQKNKIKVLVLGGGSNVLFSDKNFNGLIIKNSHQKIFKTGNNVRISSGAPMSKAVNFYIKNNLNGLEWAGGLPGTVGGAVRGNAGCFGGEMKDSVIEAESLLLEKNGEIKIIKRKNKDCGFGYRQSIFKSKNNEIVLEVLLMSKKGDKKNLQKIVNENISYRKIHHPLAYPSAGSVFKNVPLKNANSKTRQLFKNVIKYDPFPVIPAAAIINELGLKRKRIGGAEVSEKHTGFIINKNNASCADVAELINFIKKEAKRKFGFNLKEEIMIVGNKELRKDKKQKKEQ